MKAKKGKKVEPPPLPAAIAADVPDPRIDQLLAEQQRGNALLQELGELVRSLQAIDGAFTEAVSAAREKLAELVEIAKQDRTINLRLPDGRCASGQVPPRGVKKAEPS